MNTITIFQRKNWDVEYSYWDWQEVMNDVTRLLVIRVSEDIFDKIHNPKPEISKSEIKKILNNN